jgi:hypothetical protein
MCKSINIIQHINRIRDKNEYSAEQIRKKNSDIIQASFHDKCPEALRKGGTHLNIIKATHGKTTANTVLNREN